MSALLALLSLTPAFAQDTKTEVAVVIGISSYKNLPEDAALASARKDASAIGRALQDKAHFDHVFTLVDGQATRAGIRSLLEHQVAPLLTPDDTFVLYFEGHGIGADLGSPILLAHDSTLENAFEDGLEVSALANDLRTWIKARNTLIVTDAVHRDQVDGIYLYGPSASHWPRLPTGTMVLSSSQPEAPAKDGSFGAIFLEAVSGKADASYDGDLTLSEIFTHLVTQMAPTGQLPMASGDFDGNAVLARGVVNERAEVPLGTIDVSGTPGTPGPELPVAPPKPLYPDLAIDKAKFVFREGASQSVQCRATELTACAPSCYVWDLRTGPCTISAVIDGIQMTSEVIVLSRGKYDCRRKGPDLTCEGPFL